MARDTTNLLCVMALLKVFVCVLLASVALATEEDSGQYNPDLYEKPYYTTEVVEKVTTEAAEPVEAEEPAETEEPAEPAEEEPVEPSEVVAADSPSIVPAGPSPAGLPYPLLYAVNNVAPLVYSEPQFLRIAAAFPTVHH